MGDIKDNEKAWGEEIGPAVPAIQRYSIGYYSDEWGVRSLSPTGIYDDAGKWVRYEDHVAEFRRLRAYCQELESQVIRDCMSTQQPAPATQQAEGDVVAYLDVGANGYLDLGSELSEDALQQLPKGRHALVIAGTYGIDGYVAAPQPSYTAQAADSHPTPDEIINMAREQGLPETEIEGVFRVNADDLCRVAAAILAARVPADSTPAWASQAVIEYRYTGGTHWCQLGPAERMKPNFDGVYRLQGGVFPVDAPADSMTAPASGEVAGWLPVHSNGHKFYGAPLKTEAEAKQYINQVHQSSDSVTLIVRPFTWIATPPRWQTS